MRIAVDCACQSAFDCHNIGERKEKEGIVRVTSPLIEGSIPSVRLLFRYEI